MKNHTIYLVRMVAYLLAPLLVGLAPTLQAQVADLSEIGTDPRRASVVDVLIREDDTAEFSRAFVTDVPPSTHASDPPQILLEYFDVDGNLIRSRNAWDPRWNFVETEGGGEQQLLLSEATGSFGILYSFDVATVRIVDQQKGPPLQLLEIDVQSVVEDFCIRNPDEPSCFGFSSADSDDDGIPDQSDNCPEAANADQNDLDNDSHGDACDNCPGTRNPGQLDSNSDGVGDACEAIDTRSCDADNDGDIDSVDIEMIAAARDQLASGPDDPRDADGNGVIDILDARQCVLLCDGESCNAAPPGC